MNAAAMKLLYLVVLMGCCGQGIAQIQACYDGDRSCGGNVVTGVNSPRDCCLGSGFSFRNSAGTCRQCIVHGFTTTLLNVSEGDPLQRIEVSLDIKGNTFREPAPATESFGLQVRCIDSGGPQTVSSNDFIEGGCGDRLTLNIDTNPLFELGITFEDDNRLEGTEILEVQIALDDATQTAVNNSGNIFFQDTLSFSVADITVVEVGFSEDDYMADEGEPTLGRPYTPCRVTVEVINGRLELPLPIQLTPIAGNATVADFNDTIIETEIPEGETQQAEDIQIFDDEINEAPEVFNVSLDILSEQRSNVIFRIRRTLCRIRQSDPIEIGFTRERITRLEQFASQFDEIINKSRVTEQTFKLQIEISTIITGSGLQRATQDEDFAISLPNTTLVYSTLLPSERNLPFGYQIFQDDIPENTEVFQVSVTPDPRSASNPSFDCNRDNGCYRRFEVRIEDDDDLSTVDLPKPTVQITDNDLSPTAPTVTCPPCEPDTRTPDITCPPVITCPTVAPCPSIDTRPPEVTCPPVITCPTVAPCPCIDTHPPEVSRPPVITSPTTRPTLLPDTPLTQTDDEDTDVTMPPISPFITPLPTALLPTTPPTAGMSPTTPATAGVSPTTPPTTGVLPTTLSPTTMYTQRPIIKPGIIKNIQVVNMEAFWNPPSETGGEITSYLTRIRYTRSDGRRITKYKRIRDPTVHQWKPDPFPSERPVYFQVRAANSAGYGQWSKQIVLAN